MNIKIQSFDVIKPKLIKLLDSNLTRSLSGVLKALKKDTRIPMIADYPLLSFIIRYGHSRTPRYDWTRHQIMHAIRISGFYKDEGREQAYLPKEWEKYIKK